MRGSRALEGLGLCEARLGELPSIYAVADVCRPDLLFEIDGTAVVPLRPGTRR